MVREIDRYDWGNFRAPDGAGGIPKAMIDLAIATNDEDANKAYWKIDNTAVVQGALYEVAEPTITCLLALLQACTNLARPYILELLVQLASGEAHPSEIEAGNKYLEKNCLRELSRGVAIYFDVIEKGLDKEKIYCVDLLGLCCDYDSSLKPRVIWWFNDLLSENHEPGNQKLIKNWISELS